MSALAFVLNFDAELELARVGRYQRATTMTARIVVLANAMKPTLPAGSVVIDPLSEKALFDATAIAWCPTPSALRSIRAAGLTPPEASAPSVLAHVNARPFAFALAPEELSGAVLARDETSAHAAIDRPGSWLLKRCFGVSGRGQRPVRGGERNAHDDAFVAASLREDGALVIEPRVSIARELSVHAWATERVQVRSIRAQHVDAHGAFVSSAHVELEASLRDPLVRTAERVGEALIAAGYFGPFGVDAFVYRTAGALALRTLSEINARYCMGWDAIDGWQRPSA